MMLFEVLAKDGRIRAAFGTNIIEPFEAGTPMIGYGVNGRRFIMQAGEALADGLPMTISLPQIREAIRNGAPRTWKAPVLPGPGAAA